MVTESAHYLKMGLMRHHELECEQDAMPLPYCPDPHKNYLSYLGIIVPDFNAIELVDESVIVVRLA